MSVGPYQALAAELVTGSLEHVVEVTARPVGGTAFPISIEGDALSVTFSEDWSPHIQVNATAAMPLTDAQLDALDGRAGCRITVDVGYIYPDRSRDVHVLADVALRGRQVSRPDNKLGILAVSDEIRAQDRVWHSTDTPPAFTGIVGAVKWCAELAMYPEPVVIETAFADSVGSTSIDGMKVPVGSDLWSPIADLANRAGVWVHCTSDRKWRIRGRPAGTDAPVHRLAVGENGTIVTSDSGLDRGDWSNYVILEYFFTNAAGAQVTIFGRAGVTSGPFQPSVTGYRMYHEKRTQPITQAQADAAAATVLRNLVTRGRSLTLTAIAAYWLRPGHVVEVELVTGGPQVHIVQSVQFNPLAGLMTVTTRQPNDYTIQTGE
jgi:hypothetical protein